MHSAPSTLILTPIIYKLLFELILFIDSASRELQMQFQLNC